MWGLTAIYAFRAYDDRNFFDMARTIWEEYTPFVISTQDASAGRHTSKNVTFPSTCNDGESDIHRRNLTKCSTHTHTASVAGGVFNVRILWNRYIDLAGEADINFVQVTW